jgi:hypothetical protein
MAVRPLIQLRQQIPAQIEPMQLLHHARPATR